LRLGPETDVLVDDVDSAFKFFLSAGGEAVEAPFDIAIGRCARVRDPFGNELVILDPSKGNLLTDAEGRVTGRPTPSATRRANEKILMARRARDGGAVAAISR
jgi:hypothetical protein